MEIHHIGNEVNRDGIHPNPDEGLGPFLKFPELNDLVKDTQQNGAVAAGDQDVGRGPKQFDDRELLRPGETQPEADGSAPNQPIDFLLV